MSIFNRTSLMESINEIDVEPTMESVIEMGAELNESVYKLNTSLYITDLLLEQRAQAGEDVEALTEAAIGDFFSKMIKKFKKAQNKNNSFFNSVSKKEKSIVSSAEQFINKYEKGIRRAIDNNDVKWVTYTEKHNAHSIFEFMENTYRTLNNDIIKKLNAKISNSSYEELLEDANQMASHILYYEFRVNTYDEAKKIAINDIKGTKTGKKVTLDKKTLCHMLDRIKRCGEIHEYANTLAEKIDNLYEGAIHILNSTMTDGANSSYTGKRDPEFMGAVSKYCTEVSRALCFTEWLAANAVFAHENEYNYYLGVVKKFTSANAKLL